MLTALISIIFAVSGLVLILVAGIRREPPAAELSSHPPNVISAMARRLTGVYVRRPEPTANDEGR